VIVFDLVVEFVAGLFEGGPKMRESCGVLAEGVPPDPVEQARSSRRSPIEIHANGRLNLLPSRARPTIDAGDIVPDAVLIELKQPGISSQGPSCISGDRPMRQRKVYRDGEERNA
jgi:hypothetical protein